MGAGAVLEGLYIARRATGPKMCLGSWVHLLCGGGGATVDAARNLNGINPQRSADGAVSCFLVLRKNGGVR